MYGLQDLVRYKPRWASSRWGRRGFVTITITLSAVFLLGMGGLAVDVGRMYVCQDESQTFVDAAALRAALQIDGTPTGIARAVDAANATQKKFEFGTRPFDDVSIEFGKTADGPWLDAAGVPAPADKFVYVRVSTRVHSPLTLLRVATNDSEANAGASAVAGREEKTKFEDSLFPSSPYDHSHCGDVRSDGEKCSDPNDPFGLTMGRDYTIRWGGPSLKKFCDGDNFDTMKDLAAAAPVDFRGYIELNDSSTIRDTIIYDQGPYPNPIEVGTVLTLPGGGKNTQPDAVAVRYLQDLDTDAESYAEYKSKGIGNGRRVILVPINSGSVAAGGHDPFTVVGFASFFLNHSAKDYADTSGNQPLCAEYIGMVTAGGPFTGGIQPPSGAISTVLQLRLYR
jgi:hypothetical protein